MKRVCGGGGWGGGGGKRWINKGGGGRERINQALKLSQKYEIKHEGIP